MAAPQPLSEADLVGVRAELAVGKPVTVWFTAAAVGVPADGSAKVVGVGDPAEGDFIQVRPTGSRDTVFCAPNELTRTRPPRKRASPPATGPGTRPATPRDGSGPLRADAGAGTPAGPGTGPPAGSGSPSGARPAPDARATSGAQPPPRVEPGAGPAAGADPVPAGPVPVPGPRSAEAPEPAPERRRSNGRAPAPPTEVTVVLAATAEGEWTVEVTAGRKRVVRPTPVQPADVGKAARALPSAVAEAIDASLQAARRRQQERVQRLRAELDAAERALQELSG